LEEEREKKFDHYARVIQKAFRKYINQVTNMRQKEEAAGKAKSRLRFFLHFIVRLQCRLNELIKYVGTLCKE